MRHSRTIRPLLLLLAAQLTAAVVSEPVAAQCRYDAVTFQMPPCPWGGRSAVVHAINDRGHVVGYLTQCFSGDKDAFVWTPETGVRLLPRGGFVNARAHDINDAEQVVGWIGDDAADRQAVLWEDGEAHVLPHLPGAHFSAAYGINNHGDVVGVSYDAGQERSRAVLWSGGELIELKLPLEAPLAWEVSDSGYVVGDMGSWQNGRAFRARGDEVIGLGLEHAMSSEARGVNDRGDVVGYSYFRRHEVEDLRRNRKAFWWSNGRTRSLGIPPEFTEAAAGEINELGQIAGAVHSPDEFWVPVIWQSGAMWRLDELIPAHLDLTLRANDGQSALNDRGELAVSARDPDGVEFVAVLRPIMSRAGDANADCRVDIHDVLQVLDAWGPCDGCLADLDEDGFVDQADLAIVLGDWG